MLKLKSLITPSALLAAFTLVAAPTLAQEKYHGRQSEGRPQNGAAPAAPSRQQQAERAQPRAEQPRQAEQQRQAQPERQAEQQQRQAQQPQRQAEQQRQVEQPRAQSRANDNRRSDNRENRGYENRGNDNRGYDNRRYEGRAVPRGNVYAPRYEPHYAPGYSPRGYGYYGTRSYNRPYVFRPRFSIGFGIFGGYPVPYAYSYPYPIMVYGYRAPRERVMVTANSPYYGGIVLEMSPYDADVYVDGTYAGRVEDFDGATQPLTLAAGVHEIEVEAQGYEPMRINVDVQPGQVIPYRGDLRPY